jgi:hypothetical protein
MGTWSTGHIPLSTSYILTRDLGPDARAAADRRRDLLTALIDSGNTLETCGASPSVLGKGEF